MPLVRFDQSHGYELPGGSVKAGARATYLGGQPSNVKSAVVSDGPEDVHVQTRPSAGSGADLPDLEALSGCHLLHLSAVVREFPAAMWAFGEPEVPEPVEWSVEGMPGYAGPRDQNRDGNGLVKPESQQHRVFRPSEHLTRVAHVNGAGYEK